MDLRSLRLFCRVVELKSFSLAAEEMHITQPAASQQVRTLERQLGTVLIDRSSREVLPTDAGNVLHVRARQMLELQEQALMELGNLDQLHGGGVAVGASTGPGEHILPRLIMGFRERYSEVRVSLRVADTHEVIEEVLGRRLEVGVVGAPSSRDDLTVRPLARDEIVFVCAPGHPWAGRQDVTLDELRREPLVVQQEGAGIRAVFAEHLRKRGLRESDLTVAFEMGLMESAKQAVMAGAGVTYVSKFAVATETANGTLAVIRLADFRIERDFTYVHLRRRVLSRAAVAFLAYLEEQAARLT
jgi:DNA-binding transcriptional LysR family regulator